MSSVLRVAYTLTWDPKEVADGNFVLNDHTFYFHGSGVSVITDIAESLNLTVETYFGNVIGSLNLVANETADMGGLLISQDSISEWNEYGYDSLLTYLHPIDSETSDVYFRQPPADSVKNTITRPFSARLWIVLLSLILIVSLISKQSSNHSIVFVPKTLIHAVELLIGRHDVHFRVTKVPASIAVTRLIMSFFGIIISSVYIAKIASIFVMREDLVKTPDDLITYNYKLNTYTTLHVHRVFENFNRINGIAVNIVNFTKDFSFISNVIGKPKDDPRQTLFAHPDGFYSNALYSLNYNQELCSVSVLKSKRKTARSFYIRKDSLFREDLNLSIVKLIERGINHRHQVKFKSKFKYNCLQQETQFNQLTFRYVELGFVPLFVGFAAAAVMELIKFLILKIKLTEKVRGSERPTNSRCLYVK